jgi:septum site-determining protein MinC
MGNTVAFKGIPGGLRLVIDPDMEWEALMDEIREGIQTRRSFLSQGSVMFDICGRHMTREQKGEVMDVLKEAADITGVRFDPECGARDGPASRNRIFKGTVRNGQQVDCEGDLVVVGDVNPGGEACAGGNIIVLGALRGIAHAGIGGDTDSFVFAQTMAPLQVRIAGYVARPGENGTGPALIYLEDGAMTIEPIVG